MGETTSWTEKAAEISKQATWISNYVQSHGLPIPSFSLDEPQDFLITDEAIQNARSALIDACRELLEAAIGPTALLKFEIPKTVQFNSAMAVVTHFDIANHVPLNGEISFAELSSKVHLGVERLQRILRCTIAHRIFNEPRIGFVSHSAASKVLLDNGARAWLGHHLEEMLPASAKLVDSFEKYPDSEAHDETAMSMAFYGDGPKTYWEILAKEPWKVKRFCDGLEYATSTGGPHDFHHIVRAFDWKKFGRSTLVDVGGSSGRVSVAIAEVAPDLNFIVQDLPEIEVQAKAIIPDNLAHRIVFRPHDFFKPQPVKAKVYLYRQILHDWPDKEAIQILQALIPALEDGDTILLLEGVFPEPHTVPNGVERLIRSADLLMMAKHNAKERTLDMWKKLLQQADNRFVLTSVTTAMDTAESNPMIEVIWQDTKHLVHDVPER